MKRENSILQWGHERGITVTTQENRMKRVSAQCKKLRQEYEEMLTDDDKDSLGDQYVVLSMIAGILGSTASLARYAVRDILPKEDSLKSNIGQCLNSLEWMVEISQDPKHNNSVEILKEVGYYVEALERYAESKEWSLQECVEVAWEDIKDRGGCMIMGMFVKEANLEILETYGVYVQEDEEGQKMLEGWVDDNQVEDVCKVIGGLGYDYHLTEAGYRLKGFPQTLISTFENL
jgi:predicted house-cleaning noncanonical NTP pyrophosphatase (MazG superfamily)